MHTVYSDVLYSFSFAVTLFTLFTGFFPVSVFTGFFLVSVFTAFFPVSVFSGCSF